jgi:hypothetical protein
MDVKIFTLTSICNQISTNPFTGQRLLTSEGAMHCPDMKRAHHTKAAVGSGDKDLRA